MRFLFNSHKIVFLVLRSRFTFVSKLHYVTYIYTHVCLLIEISLYFLFTIIISLHTICDFVLRTKRREREREKKKVEERSCLVTAQFFNLYDQDLDVIMQFRCLFFFLFLSFLFFFFCFSFDRNRIWWKFHFRLSHTSIKTDQNRVKIWKIEQVSEHTICTLLKRACFTLRVNTRIITRLFSVYSH